MSKRQFDLLRACFYLLAFIMIIEMVATIAGGALCWYVNITTVRQPGACLNVVAIIREVWSEILTAVLALLLAGRSQPPSKGNDDDHSSDSK